MRLRAFAAACVAAVLAVVPARAGAQDARVSEGVAATVDGQPITRRDVTQRIRLLLLLSGLKVEEADLPWLEAYAVKGLVDDRLKTQAFAKVAALSELDAEVEAEIAAMAPGGAAQVRTELDAAGIGIEPLRDYLRARRAWALLVRGRYGGRINVSGDALNAELARMASPATAKQRVAALFLRDLPGGQEATLAAAGRIAARIHSVGDFFVLAQTFSEPSTIPNSPPGQWMDAVALGSEIVPTRAGAGGTLEPPTPVGVRGGVMLVVALESYDGEGAGQTPPAITREEVEARLRARLMTAVADKAFQDLVSGAVVDLR